jgi:hypothetical protein
MQKITSFLLLLALFLNSSCITRQVKKGSSYTESFRGYFLSKRNNEIVFIGKEYHYIFKDESGHISELIKPKWKGKIKISQIKLRVDKNNNVYGDINLEFVGSKEVSGNSKGGSNLTNLELKKLNTGHNFRNNAATQKNIEPEQISAEQEFFLKEQGFVKNNNNKFNKNMPLKGIRYKPAIGFNDKINESFAKEYKAEIFYDGNIIKKAKLTPIAYAADGLIILAGGVWIPLIIIATTDEKTPERVMNRFKHYFRIPN